MKEKKKRRRDCRGENAASVIPVRYVQYTIDRHHAENSLAQHNALKKKKRKKEK